MFAKTSVNLERILFWSNFQHNISPAYQDDDSVLGDPKATILAFITRTLNEYYS